MLEQRLNWDLQEEVGHWAVQTFPKATHTSITAHMYKELQELRAAKTTLNKAEECADLYLMLLHLAHINGFDLFLSGRHKLDICRGRTWCRPDAEGVVEHDRSKEKNLIKFKAVKRKR